MLLSEWMIEILVGQNLLDLDINTFDITSLVRNEEK